MGLGLDSEALMRVATQRSSVWFTLVTLTMSRNEICIDLYLYCQSLTQIHQTPSQSDKIEITLSNVVIQNMKEWFWQRLFQKSLLLNVLFTAFKFGVKLKRKVLTPVLEVNGHREFLGYLWYSSRLCDCTLIERSQFRFVEYSNLLLAQPSKWWGDELWSYGNT